MILLKNFERALKTGLYLDYMFKNITVNFFKNFFSKNLFYFLDKYLAEKFFYSFKNFFNIVFNSVAILKNLNFQQILKLFYIVLLQILLIILL
jgi:hypothetical protein